MTGYIWQWAKGPKKAIIVGPTLHLCLLSNISKQYSQTCIRQSLLVQLKNGHFGQVSSYKTPL